MEELVAESFSTVFLQEKAIQTLYETDEGTFRKVFEALKSFLSDLKAAIAEIKHRRLAIPFRMKTQKKHS